MGAYPTEAGGPFPPPATFERSRNGQGTTTQARAAEDRALVERASRDDAEAFARLIRRHSALVYRVALRVLGPATAPDASQEVWIRVWNNLGKFRGESAFTTWLYRVALNTCLTGQRREARRHQRELQGHEAPLLPGSRGAEDDPEAAALSGERRGEIEAALEHIRPEHRAALVLRHMEGLPYAEVAEALEVPIGTAKGWASRGRASMLVVLTDTARPSGSPPKAT